VVHWETEEAADAASAQPDVIAAFVKLSALRLMIDSRKIYEVVAGDEIVQQPDEGTGLSGSKGAE